MAHGHGGKDRHPFAAPLEVYDETIGVLKAAVRAPSSARTKRRRRLRGSIANPGDFLARLWRRQRLWLCARPACRRLAPRSN